MIFERPFAIKRFFTASKIIINVHRNYFSSWNRYNLPFTFEKSSAYRNKVIKSVDISSPQFSRKDHRQNVQDQP